MTSLADLRARLHPDEIDRADRLADRLGAALRLQQLRQGLALSQQTLAERIGIDQPTISKLERREDMLLSTLQAYCEALGGELELHVRFGEQRVAIDGLLGSTSSPRPRALRERRPAPSPTPDPAP